TIDGSKDRVNDFKELNKSINAICHEEKYSEIFKYDTENNELKNQASLQKLPQVPATNQIASEKDLETNQDSSMEKAVTNEISLKDHVVANKIVAPGTSKDTREESSGRLYNYREVNYQWTLQMARLAHLISFIFLSFVCCYTPFLVCVFIYSIEPGKYVGPTAIYITTNILVFNSFTNVLIYITRSSDYRRAFKNIVTCRGTTVHPTQQGL
ncbi:unnamed protein product, partial [Owenia fusiformis]